MVLTQADAIVIEHYLGGAIEAANNRYIADEDMRRERDNAERQAADQSA